MAQYAVLTVLAAAAAFLLRPLQRPYSQAVALTGIVLLTLVSIRLLGPILTRVQELSALWEAGEESLGLALSLAGTALMGDMACSICRQLGEEELARSCALVTGIILMGMTLPVLWEVWEWLSACFS